MKTSTKIKTFLIVVFITIFAVITARHFVGLHFKKKYQTNILRNKVLHELIEKNQKNRYLVNINPRNKSLISFYKSKKFKKIQHTYELIKRV